MISKLRIPVINVLNSSRMSSKSKHTKNAKTQKTEEPKAPASDQPVYTDKSGQVCIRILAKPGAKVTQITDINEEGVGVQISAPPIDGEANTELIKYLAKSLNLRKSEVSLDRGSKSRQKTVILEKGVLTVDAVLTLLKKECDA